MTGQVVPDEMMIVMAPRNDDVYNSVSFHSQVCSNCQSRPCPLIQVPIGRDGAVLIPMLMAVNYADTLDTNPLAMEYLCIY